MKPAAALHRPTARVRDAMRVIGFEFYGGSFNALSPRGRLEANTVSAPPEGSYGQYFHSAGIPLFFLDLHGITPGSGTTDWLVGPRRIWDIGSRYASPLANTAEVSLPRMFDGVIFIDTLTPTTLRP